jgi:uncharacterized membrane protein YhiD involved in acid resistance
MSFVDTIKKGVLSEFTGTLSIGDMALSLLVAFLIGIYIIYIYKKTYTGVVYSKSFALCIIMLSMVTALIIRTINSNLALSLGMVGALSIVRFRTAVKEPVDTAFMFWGISAGIMAGAGLYIPGIIGSLLLGAFFFGSYLMGFKANARYLLVLKFEDGAYENVLKGVKALGKAKMKSNSSFKDTMELTYEIDIKVKDEDTKRKIVEAFKRVPGMINVSLISYQNDFGD